MSENTPTDDWTVADIDSWAAEHELTLTGNKAEKLDQVEAYLADQGDEDTVEVEREPDLPEPQTEPPAPAPGEDDDAEEDEPASDFQQEIADGKRHADGTVKPKVQPRPKATSGFSTGLASTAAQFKHRKDTPSSLPESEGSSA